MSEKVSPRARNVACMMAHYMAWANKVKLESASHLPSAEIVRHRASAFGNIAHTFNHIFVIEDIFRCHLEGRPHGYRARNTEVPPPFDEVRGRLEAMDQYYVELAERLSVEELNEVIRFEYVGGGNGAMTRQEIILHLANHATYHRGFISVMFHQVPFVSGSDDLSVFLRDVWPRLDGTSN